MWEVMFICLGCGVVDLRVANREFREGRWCVYVGDANVIRVLVLLILVCRRYNFLTSYTLYLYMNQIINTCRNNCNLCL